MNEVFKNVDMSGAQFTQVRLNGATLQSCELNNVVMRSVDIIDTSIDGEIVRLVINGVDVAPMVEAELDRREPERAKFRPSTAEGFRAAWDLNESLWSVTLDRARQLPEDALHESVNGEWSFIQTLRHLAFATESWVGRCVLGDPTPWHPLSLPWDEMSPRAGVPQDRDARPALDDVLPVRAMAIAMVRGVVDGLTDEALQHQTEPLVGTGWPDEGETFPVWQCLRIVLNEEWCHRGFAERDLALLEQRRP